MWFELVGCKWCWRSFTTVLQMFQLTFTSELWGLCLYVGRSGRRSWLLPGRSLCGWSAQNPHDRSCVWPKRKPSLKTTDGVYLPFPVNTSHMCLRTNLHCGWTTVDGLPLQSDLAAIRPEAGPIPEDSGMLKQQHKMSLNLPSLT